MNDLVSIIIPVLNGESYIDRLFSSLACQTYRPLEVIIIDDGSTDSSLKKLYLKVKDLKLTDFKVVILNQENKGIAASRNLGIEISSGKYLMFHDQDDWLDDNCVEVLVKAMVSDDCDMVISGYRSIDFKGKCRAECSLVESLSWSKYRITAPWGRIFSKETIEKKNIYFYDTKISEDLYFNILYICSVKKIKVISYIGYNWYYNKTSESHLNWSKADRNRNPIKMLNELQKRIKSGNWNNEKEKTYFFAKYLIWYLLFTTRGSQKEVLKRNIHKSFNWLDQYYPDYKLRNFKDINYPSGEPFGIRACITFVILLKKLGLIEAALQFYRRI